MVKVIFVYNEGEIVEMEFEDIISIFAYASQNVSLDKIKSIIILT